MEQAIAQVPPQSARPLVTDYALPHTAYYEEKGRKYRTTATQKNATTAIVTKQICVNEGAQLWETVQQYDADLAQCQEVAANYRLQERLAQNARRQQLIQRQQRTWDERDHKAGKTYVVRDKDGRVVSIIEEKP